ncbi:polysaccharide deacetylase family protein [Rhizobium sp. XQZ8]|uniref:polysaccharide deacetylase family protein n=1 Tax=Rhizobium populisoli TaxID=2859785 RepID=UPI001CA51347|nr:polysaccharide deacetylase family protein [Rhizobium populisoli]MBW6426176.1 polysaccharide deacetylase family protein [Rhizobium populisoli]
MPSKSGLELTRRSFVGAAATGALAEQALPAVAKAHQINSSGAGAKLTTPGAFWPDGARLAISISLMFKGTGQAISGACGALPEPIKPGLPDQATNAFFGYGVNEGIPRALDLFDKHDIKVTSFMIGKVIEQNPDLAREIVKRGHEAGAHGQLGRRPMIYHPRKKKRISSNPSIPYAYHISRWAGTRILCATPFTYRRHCKISDFSTASMSQAGTNHSLSRFAIGTLPYALHTAYE